MKVVQKALMAFTMFLLVAVAPVMAGNNDGSTAAGIQFGYPGNVGLSLRFDRIAIGAAWHVGDNGYVHVTADYWLLKSSLAKNLDWYLGPGVNLGLGNPFALGVRLPVGLQWIPAEHLEIFGEVAPCLWLIDAVDLNINGAVGIRYIF
ncbi:MAG: hypothetical protein IPI24_08795 [Ignavibacteria bacterium]|nr:hypothetical protein [Ignavibacteria bacterium]MBK7577515.1 hypothetical protein [Ignavibacteria bacterium]MBK9183398.1 hypothetical protein [Ignavibacteria bacterium]